MISDDEVLVNGMHIQQRISNISTLLDSLSEHQERLTLSFDVYCSLLNYTILMNDTNPNQDLLLQELLLKEDLLFDTGRHQLYIAIDFYASRDSITIC
ncbi:MAG: hypothetical protein WCI84_07270 [Bacteroidota bacterium]